MKFSSPHNYRKIVKFTVAGVVVLIIYAALQVGLTLQDGLFGDHHEPAPTGYYRVIDVADGDTFTVTMAGREQEVRLVGVDTPETHHPDKPVQCYGPEASKFTTSLIDGQAVKLEADSRQSNRDRYDRLLRYVYLEDGRELNELLVKKGYAFATNFHTEKRAMLKNLQRIANTESKGLWKACDVSRSNGYLQTNPR